MMGTGDVDARMEAALESQYDGLAVALRRNDTPALDSLLAAAPAAAQRSLREAAGRDAGTIDRTLRAARPALVQQARSRADQVKSLTRAAFAGALTRTFLLSLVFAAVAWLATWFVPELPLRKTVH